MDHSIISPYLEWERKWAESLNVCLGKWSADISFLYSFNSFEQHILIEHLVSVKLCDKHREYKSEKDRVNSDVAQNLVGTLEMLLIEVPIKVMVP